MNLIILLAQRFKDGQTPNAPEAEEYDEIVLAGDEQASQYSAEEVLVHKL